MRLLSLHFESGSGHKAIVDAVCDRLIRFYPGKFNIKTVEFLDFIGDKALSFSTKKLYNDYLVYFPQLYHLYYKIGDNRLVIELLAKLLNRKKYWIGIRKIIDVYKPDVCLTFNPHLADHFKTVAKEDGIKLPVINIVTDPFSIHSLWASPDADLVLSFSQIAKQRMIELGTPEDRIAVLPYPVRDEFCEKYSINQLRDELNIPKSNFTITIIEGGSGIEKIIKSLEILLNKNIKNTTILIATGKNRKYFNEVEKLSLRYPEIIIPFSFTSKINLYMAASDLIAGKAGPGVIFEALCLGKPILVTGYMPGQEAGNYEYIRDNNFGWAAFEPQKIAELMYDIINNQSILDTIKTNINKQNFHSGTNEIVKIIYSYCYDNIKI